MEDNTPDEKRRSILKGIGAAAGASIFGLGSVTASSQETDVSTSQIQEYIGRDEIQAVSDRVGMSTAQADEASGKELTLYKNAGVELSRERWVVIPHGTENSVAYNPEERIAETQTESGAVVRATFDDGEVLLEELEFGEAITDEVLTTLEKSAEYKKALEQANVVSTRTDAAEAHSDTVSGTTRAFVPAVQRDGSEVMLLVELDATNRLESVYGLPTSSGPGTAGAIDCWADCITFGFMCRFVCGTCVADPSRISCAPCAVCIGGTASACAVKCGIEEFW